MKKEIIYGYIDQMWNTWVSLEVQTDVLIQKQIEVTSKRLEELFENWWNFLEDLENKGELLQDLRSLENDYPWLAIKIMLIKNVLLDNLE